MIEQDTIRLLRECDAGIKMGVASIGDVLPHIRSDAFRDRLARCMAEHEQLGREIRQALDRFHDRGKDPGAMARGMSALKTVFELAIDATDATAASLITDGCNMGVKSLNQYLNQYQAADESAKDIAGRLIHLEEKLTADIRAYL